jgi:cellobiose phosphorylase
MQSAIRYLIIEKEGVSLLLYPPFDKTNKNPGYIKKYYPGIRENGGQYTHAAVWLAIAAAMANDYDLSYSLFTMLNPIHICSDKKGTLQYEKEPYVMTADISFHAPYTGRGGWSWYTGSAGWMYQGLVKEFLGIKKEKDELVIDSKTPASFGSYTIHYKHISSTYSIKVERVGRGIMDHGIFILDGVRLRTNRIKLVNDGKQHLVTVFYG